MNQTFNAEISYSNPDSNAVGLIVTEHLPSGVRFVDAEPTPIITTDANLTTLKWLIFSEEPFKTTVIKYSAVYTGGEIVPMIVGNRTLHFQGEYEWIDVEGTKYNGTITGEEYVRVTLETGLPGPWDDDGKVTDSELLEVIRLWVSDEVSDGDLLQYIQLWVKTIAA